MCADGAKRWTTLPGSWRKLDETNATSGISDNETSPANEACSRTNTSTVSTRNDNSQSSENLTIRHYAGESHVSDHRCCNVTASGSGGKATPPTSTIGRCLDTVGWIVSGAALALLPKCPACIAAYIAIGTGIGISVSTATYLRMMSVVLCLAALSYLGARRLRRSIYFKSANSLRRTISSTTRIALTARKIVRNERAHS
jgi:hypothetical protein